MSNDENKLEEEVIQLRANNIQLKADAAHWKEMAESGITVLPLQTEENDVVAPMWKLRAESSEKLTTELMAIIEGLWKAIRILETRIT